MAEYQRGVQLIVVLYLVQILYSFPWDTTMIIFRCKRINTHFLKYRDTNYEIDYDPMNLLNSNEDDRRTLCNAVINATQFTYQQDTRSKNTLLPESDQLLLASPSKLKLEDCPVKLGGRRQIIRCLRCAHTTNVQWLVAFGRPNSFMYIFKPGVAKKEFYFRFTGLIEPRAIINGDQTSLQFPIQLRESEAKMKEICQMDVEDRLRICSTVFDALNAEKMPRTNGLQVFHNCKTSIIREKDFEIRAGVMPCKIVGTSSQPPLKKFCILADISEPGAAFIFTYTQIKKGRLPVLKLHTRATRIGALLYPIGDQKINAEATPPPDFPQESISKGTASQQNWKPVQPTAHPHTYVKRKWEFVHSSSSKHLQPETVESHQSDVNVVDSDSDPNMENEENDEEFDF